MVMSFGQVSEFDDPQKLMKNPKSHFAKLVNELQKEESEKDLEKKKADAFKSDDESNHSD